MREKLLRAALERAIAVIERTRHNIDESDHRLRKMAIESLAELTALSPCPEDDPVTGTEGMVLSTGEGGGEGRWCIWEDCDGDPLYCRGHALEVGNVTDEHEAIHLRHDLATLRAENERLKAAPRFMCPYCVGGETDDVDEIVAHCETCEARPEFHLKRDLATLRKLAGKVLVAMEEWGAEEDGIPDGKPWLSYEDLKAHLTSPEPETARRGAGTDTRGE